MVSVRAVAPILLLVAVPIFGAAKKATSSSHPPRQLHRAGDHWTAYNPPDPATYGPSAKTYTIKHGDTLWALAQQFYNNAYLWPQLWESNTWITDAHWIYPGDVLLVEGEAAQAASGTSSADTTPAVGSATPTAPATSNEQVIAGGGAVATAAPVPLGTEADVYCFGYIGDPNEPMPNRVGSYEDVESFYEVGAMKQEIGGSSSDLVYLDGGTATGLVAGETYLVVEPGDMVTHPETGQTIGRQWEYRGQIRVLCADDHFARGIVTESCMDIHIGARLKPLPQIPIPLARIPDVPAFCDPASGKAQGYIVNAEGGWGGALASGILIEINLGHDDAVQPGDFLTVWRNSPQPGQPRQVIGEVGVLTTEAHTATARIVGTRYHMTIGDHVERQ
jgi:nucleoid-associated protein YgaU